MTGISRFVLGLLSVLLGVSAAFAEENADRVMLRIRASDPEGGRLTFTWTQVDGPRVRIADPNAGKLEGGKWVSETYFIPTEPGRYTFEVAVKNEQGIESKKQFTKDVTPPAPAPVAVAGANKAHTQGEVVRLNGIDSKASPGKAIAEWEWRVVQAPEKFKLDPKLLKERAFDFKAVEPGAYQFELRIFDGTRWSEPSRVMVTVNKPAAPPTLDEPEGARAVELPPNPGNVPPKRPEVKAVVKPGKVVKVGEKIVLDGSASIAPKELRPDFYWDSRKGFIRETVADRTKPFDPERSDAFNYPVWTLTPTEPGEFVWVLKITCHNKGAGLEKEFTTESEEVRFNVIADVPVVAEKPPENPVKPENPPAAKKDPPVAKIFLEKANVEVGDAVRLDGAQSKDPLGEKIEYLWGPAKGSKRIPKKWAGNEGPVVEFTAEEEGIYNIALIVKAGERYSDPVEVAITVGPANEPPIIKLVNKIECMVGEQLRIEADVRDPENDKLDVTWSCIDPADLKIPDRLAKHYDPASHTSSLVFVPKNPGAYVFRIEVVDGKGRKETAQTMVGVKEILNRVPTAKIEGPEDAKAGTKVRLSGAKSVDPEKKPLRYFWKQLEGPEIKTIPGENDSEWTFSPEHNGRYVFSLTVSDGVNSSDADKFPLNVVKNNTPPAAAVSVPAGGRIGMGEAVVLDAGASSDAENDTLTFKWRKLDGGKGDVTLEDVDKPRAKVTGTAPGDVRLELVVNDGVTDSDPKTVTLFVARKNSPPVAKIAGPTSARVGETVEFSAEGSTDVDGDELSFVWSQPADGGPEIGARGRDLRKSKLRFRVEKPGTYTLNLEAIDAEGAKSELTSQSFSVKGINKPPRAVAAVVGGERFSAGSEVKLSARGSLDPDGQALTYKWVQTDGPLVQIPAPDQEVINFVINEPGNYEFELSVNDGDSDSPPAKVTLTVGAANHAPVPLISEVLGTEPGGKVTLDASGSKDTDNDKLEFQWRQVSGPKVEFPWRGERRSKVEVKLAEEGEYVFEVKVFDGKEWSEPKTVAVRTRAQNQPPIAGVKQENVRTEIGVEAILDASPSSDPDNGPAKLTYNWKQTGGGRCEVEVDGAIARVKSSKEGNFTFQVIVNDGKANSNPAHVSVNVVKPGLLPVAVAEANVRVLKAAKKGDPNDPNILILDGRRSKSPNGALIFTWKQIAGDDLRLQPAQLAKDRVGMRIFVPGDYRFSLVVSDGQASSQEAVVDVQVVGADGTPAPKRDPEPQAPPRRDPEPEIAPRRATEPESKPAPVTPARGAPSIDEEGGAKGGSSFEEPRGSNQDGALLAPPKDSSKGGASRSTPEQETLRNLAKDNDPEAEKKLIAALSSDDAVTRSLAGESLYRRGMASIPALIEVLDTGNAGAKKEAYWALRELTHESLGQDAQKWRDWWAKQPGSKK